MGIISSLSTSVNSALMSSSVSRTDDSHYTLSTASHQANTAVRMASPGNLNPSANELTLSGESKYFQSQVTDFLEEIIQSIHP